MIHVHTWYVKWIEQFAQSHIVAQCSCGEWRFIRIREDGSLGVESYVR